jgi:chemotaxis methyl-accepting protein methylase
LWGSPVTPLDYDFLRKCLKERSGLVLSADKQYLVESRLLPVARKAGLATLRELVAVLKLGDAEALMTAVVEAMTTNESLFFRDKVPFEHFRSTILPALMAARRATRTIRIWCAAAATGQEPCSLAIILKEMERELAGWRVDLVATDLSNEVLEKAQQGIYSHFEVQRGLPIHLLIRYFTPSGDMWRLAPELRAMVKYRQAQSAVGLLSSRDVRCNLLPDKPRARLVGGGKPQWQPRIGCIQAALVRNNHEAVGQPHHRFGRAKHEIAVPGDGLCKPLEEIDLRLLIEIDEHVAAVNAR